MYRYRIRDWHWDVACSLDMVLRLLARWYFNPLWVLSQAEDRAQYRGEGVIKTPEADVVVEFVA